MVYKRYARKNGKIYGPYFYESYRENGVVKKRYIGAEDPSNPFVPQKSRLPVVLLVVVLLGLILTGFVLYHSLTGSVVLETEKNYALNQPLTGVLHLTIEEGDSLDEDSPVFVSLKKDSAVLSENTITLSEFIGLQSSPVEVSNESISCVNVSIPVIEEVCNDVFNETTNETITLCENQTVNETIEEQCTPTNVTSSYYQTPGTYSKPIQEIIAYTFAEPGSYTLEFSVPAAGVSIVDEINVSLPEENETSPEQPPAEENLTIPQPLAENATNKTAPLPFEVQAEQHLTSCGSLDVANDIYLLDNDVSSTGSCFNITANDIVLDCNGSAIEYNLAGSNSSFGITALDRTNLTIKNCIIRDVNASGYYSAGINFTNVTNSLIQNNSIYTNGTGFTYGIFLDHKLPGVYNEGTCNNNSIISNTIVMQITGTPPTGHYHPAIYINVGYRNTIAYNNLLFNSTSYTYGIRAWGNYTNITANNITIITSSNDIKGLWIEESANVGSNNIISSNNITVAGTSDIYGIDIATSNDSIINNNIRINVSDEWNSGGVTSWYNEGENISSNTITLFGLGSIAGIYLEESGGHTITANNIQTNSPNHTTMRFILSNNSVISSNIFNNTLGDWIYSSDSWLNNLTDNTFATANGSIKFTGLIQINGTQNISRQYFNISYNYAYLNSTNLTFMNQSANITLTGIELINPHAYVDFQDDGTFEACDAPQCNYKSYSPSTKVFVFNVSSFTTYSAQEEETACGDVNKSIILVTNVAANKTCFTVNASDVTIDCNGYSIFYNANGSNNAFGVVARGLSNITVKNCLIQDTNYSGTYGYGINFTAVNSSFILNNSIYTNGTASSYGIYLFKNSYENTITNNTISTFGNVSGLSYGIYLGSNSSKNNITLNNITTNGTTANYGIYLDTDEYNNTLRGNTIQARGSTNLNHGIYLKTRASWNRVTSNNVTTQGTTTNYGIVLETAAANNTLDLNTISTQGGTGGSNYGIYITAAGSENNTISYNNITTNGSGTNNYGIYLLTYVKNTLILKNNIRTWGTSTGDDGIYVSGSSGASSGNNITGNNLIADGDSGDIGIILTTAAPNNTIVLNTITTYGSVSGSNYGIEITSAGSENNTVSYNNITTSGNGGSNYGVYVYSSAHDNIVTNNIINTSGTSTNNYGIYLYTTISGTIVANNTVSTNGTSANSGIVLQTTVNDNSVTNNTVNTYGSSGASSYGIHLTGTTHRNNITENRIITNGTTTNYGILLQSTGDNNTVNYNNITAVGRTGASNHGIYLQGSGNTNASYNIINTRGTQNNIGILLESSAKNNTCAFNTITTQGNTSTGTNYGIYVSAAGTQNNTFYNNVIMINASGADNHGVYISSAHNNVFSLTNITTNGTATYAVSILTANRTVFTDSVLFNSSGWIETSGAGYIANFTNTTFADDYGKVVFADMFWLNNTRDISRTRLNITSNKVYLNSTNLTFLNTSAEVTLTGLSFTEAKAIVSFNDNATYTVCSAPQCVNLSYNAGTGTFVFNVSSFTTYSSMEGALDVDINAPANGSMLNYTNVTFSINASSGVGLANATINIYNQTGSLYNRTTVDLGGIVQTTVSIVVWLADGIYSWFWEVVDLANNLINTGTQEGYNRTLEVNTTFLCSQCSTLTTSGTYIVTQDIYYTGDSCIIVTASDTTVDCNGHLIDGDGFASGVYISLVDGITIKNCRINNFTYGIRMEHTDNHELLNNTLTYNNDGIYMYDSFGNVVTGNNASLGINDGFDLSTFSGTVTDNTAYDNGANGFNFNSASATITNNTAYSNSGAGFSISYLNDSSITGNTANSNGQGISITSGFRNTLLGNKINDSTGSYGIYMFVSEGNKFINNSVNNSNLYAIYLSSSHNNNLTGNKVMGAPTSAYLGDSDNNTLLNNSFLENGYGIYLSYSNNTNVTSNVVRVGINAIWFGTGMNSIFNNNNLTTTNGNTITLLNADNNNFTNNIIQSETNYNVDLDADSYSVNNIFTNMTTRQNLVSFRFGNGLLFKGLNNSLVPAEPAGKNNLSRWFNATNNSATSWLIINASYDESDLGGVLESSLGLWRFNNALWENSSFNQPYGIDTVNNIAYANITNFSTFGILGDEPPLTCGDVATSTTLLNNVTSNTTCFNITANNVVLDCNGNRIEFDLLGRGNTSGVIARNIRNLTIKNCVIADVNASGAYGSGINFTGVNDSLIYNNTVYMNCTYGEYGLSIQANSDNNNVSSNKIVMRGSVNYIYGILLKGYSDNNTIANNVVTDESNVNGNYGIFLYNNVTQNRILRNNVSLSGTYNGNGLFADIDVINNTIFGNNLTVSGTFTNYGIYLSTENGGRNNISANRIYVYGTYDINGMFIVSERNTIKDNYVLVNTTDTVNYGMLLYGGWASHNSLDNNTLVVNGPGANYGVRMENGANNNSLSRNTIYALGTGYSHYGIFLYDNSAGMNATGNTIVVDGEGGNIGIQLYNYVYNSSVSHNVISTNGTDSYNVGVSLYNFASNNSVAYNNITTNGTGEDEGISVEGNSHSNTVYGNNIRTYGYSYGSNYGINLESATSWNNVTENNITTNGAGNQNYGIVLQSTVYNSSINKNLISTNGLLNNYGIYLYGTIIDNSLNDNIVYASGSEANHGLILEINIQKNIIRNNSIATNGTSSYGIFLISASNNTFSLNLLNNSYGWINSSASYNNSFSNDSFATLNGSLRFINTFQINGTHDVSRQKLNISYNYTYLNSTNLTFLNTSAEITLYGIEGFTSPHAFVDFEDDGSFVQCNSPQCYNISYNPATKVFVFNVSSFTSYRVQEEEFGSSCGEVSSSLALLNNVTSNTSCFNITADNVTLDCDGYSIFYNANGSNNAFGVAARGLSNITVKNCLIKDINSSGTHGYGLNFSLINNSLILNNSIYTNSTNYGYGIYLSYYSLNNNLTDNSIVTGNNLAGGGTSYNYGIAVEKLANNNLIDNNRINTSGGGNENDCISITNASENNITRNTLRSSGLYAGNTGLFLYNRANNNLMKNNYIITNGSSNNHGVYIVTSSNNNTLFNNTIVTGGAGDVNQGILLYLGASGNNITGNVINATRGYGIYVWTSANNNRFYANNITATGISTYGIGISEANNSVFDSNVLNNPSEWIANGGVFNNFTNTTFLMPNGSIRIIPTVQINSFSSVTKTRLNISYNYTYLNSTNLTFLNTSAEITLYGISFTYPQAFVDFEDDGSFVACDSPQCYNVSYNPTSKVFVFNVSSFTTYIAGKAVPNIALTITPSNSVTEGTETNATGSGCPDELNCTLYRNGVAVINSDVATLAAGTYDYVYNTTGNENYSSANVSATLTVSAVPGEGGGGGGCTDTSWTCGDWEECAEGQQSRSCTSNCDTTRTETRDCCTDVTWTCGDWTNCVSNMQSRECTSNCNNPRTEERACECIPDWQCTEFSVCSFGKMTRSCTDVNNCGTEFGKPAESRDCRGGDCRPYYLCGNWSGCGYGNVLNDVITGKISYTGYRERTCIDYNNCADSYIEYENCTSGVEIETAKADICDEDTLTLIEKVTKTPITTINLDTWRADRLDVAFTQERVKYCPSCYDGIQDGSEEGIDCGGECRACRPEYRLPAALIAWLLALLAALLLVPILKIARADDDIIEEIRTLIKSGLEALKRKDRKTAENNLRKIKWLYIQIESAGKKRKILKEIQAYHRKIKAFIVYRLFKLRSDRR